MLHPTHTTEQNAEHNVLRYLDQLYRYALALTRNHADAEDLVQETYLRALRAFHRLRPNSHLKCWMFTIMRNIRLNQIRRAQGAPRMIEVGADSRAPFDLADTSARTPLDLYLTEVKEKDVTKAVESLSASCREVIVLRAFEELSYDEIAKVLDCPVGTVMSRLARARDKLKELLRHKYTQPKYDVTKTYGSAGASTRISKIDM
jgi:RNA polymerase sigma-70 factor (ECF subfamily)